MLKKKVTNITTRLVGRIVHFGFDKLNDSGHRHLAEGAEVVEGYDYATNNNTGANPMAAWNLKYGNGRWGRTIDQPEWTKARLYGKTATIVSVFNRIEDGPCYQVEVLDGPGAGKLIEVMDTEWFTVLPEEETKPKEAAYIRMDLDPDGPNGQDLIVDALKDGYTIAGCASLSAPEEYGKPHCFVFVTR